MIEISVNYEFEILLALLRKETHGRALVGLFNVSLDLIQRNLRKLEQNNVLDYTKEGRNHVYFIKKNLIAKSYILNAENYKLVKLLMKWKYLEPLFDEMTRMYPGEVMILFGSYAKFIPKEDSDIDIYLLTSDEKKKKRIKQLHDKISIKGGSFNIGEPLIKEIINNHVIIQGGEKFYEKTKFFG